MDNDWMIDLLAFLILLLVCFTLVDVFRRWR
nr:MAG TPA: hypothetical protein [Caudoviricetes sp.]